MMTTFEKLFQCSLYTSTHCTMIEKLTGKGLGEKIKTDKGDELLPRLR